METAERERHRIKVIIQEWADDRELGVDALMAKIDGIAVIADDEFEIPDLNQELQELTDQLKLYKILAKEKGFRAAIKEVFNRL